VNRQFTKLHNAWYGLLRRYGAAPGNPVLCPRWRESFAAFAEDLGPPPDPHAVLCRRDRRRAFEPGNVYWGNPRDRQQAVAHAHILELNGRRQSLSAWAAELGILPRTLRERLAKTAVAEALVPKPFYRSPRRRPAKSPHCASCFLGVYKAGRKWEAKIRIDGALHYLGLFVRETDAARAVQRARLERDAVLQAKRIAAQKAATGSEVLDDLRGLVASARQAVVMSPTCPPPGGDLKRASSKLKMSREERRLL
jgi:hypothetical protein